MLQNALNIVGFSFRRRRDQQVQWGKTGSGIEHGMIKDDSYQGVTMGFQMWVNLRKENKMDPPIFQNAKPDALPTLQLAPKVQAKVLVGELGGARSPIDTQGIACQYIDYMLEAGGEALHPRTAGMTSLFVYVYEGAGAIGADAVAAQKGDSLQLGDAGDVPIRAGPGSGIGLLLLAGAPLREPIVQHGPFVMSSQAEIAQAFKDYQRGRFLSEKCEYRLHTAEGTQVTTRTIDPAYALR